jgi:hypothetical protein
MLANKNQAIVSGLLGLGVAGLAVATALPFNDRIEYRIGNRIESQPAWLVPPKAEFRAIERGYGGIKILLALLATGGCVVVMLIARKEGELEPVRQRIKKYQEKAYEFGFAAESAYQMATTQNRYKKLTEADERALRMSWNQPTVNPWVSAHKSSKHCLRELQRSNQSLIPATK